jgi:hypothetical protein
LYKFLFKEADALRVQAMARTKVEKSHRDPFFQQQPQQQTRRARLYSVVGSPHYMAAEILEGSGYDAVADWCKQIYYYFFFCYFLFVLY